MPEERHHSAAPSRLLRTVLVCHEGAWLNREVIARWLASFSNLAGIVVLREKRSRGWRRIRRELRRVGPLRFLDVVAFRVYYRLFHARNDRRWLEETGHRLRETYPPVNDDVPVLVTTSPNSAETERFVRDLEPDVMIARCKTLIKENVFSLPSNGTFVFHPGICPEYRNSHGCFWALAEGDPERVGMTLLRIDNGVDTGPIFGFYSYPFDASRESHAVIQHRVVLENLQALERRLIEIHEGTARPLETRGRQSAAWGQPWLSSYFKSRLAARNRASGEGKK